MLTIIAVLLVVAFLGYTSEPAPILWAPTAEECSGVPAALPVGLMADMQRIGDRGAIVARPSADDVLASLATAHDAAADAAREAATARRAATEAAIGKVRSAHLAQLRRNAARAYGAAPVRPSALALASGGPCPWAGLAFDLGLPQA